MPHGIGCTRAGRPAGTARGSRRGTARRPPADACLGVGVARRVGQPVFPGDHPAARVQPGAQPVHAAGTVEVLAQVLFAGPQHLHRRADRLGQVRRLRAVVRDEPPAEAAARAGHVHRDRGGGKSGHARHQLPHAVGVLHRPPDLGPSGPTSARQFIGSIGACARSGARRSPRHRAARARGPRRPRSDRLARASTASSIAARIASVSTGGPGTRSQVACSARSPCIAAQVESATTATPCRRCSGLGSGSIRTMRLTPGTAPRGAVERPEPVPERRMQHAGSEHAGHAGVEPVVARPVTIAG